MTISGARQEAAAPEGAAEGAVTRSAMSFVRSFRLPVVRARVHALARVPLARVPRALCRARPGVRVAGRAAARAARPSEPPPSLP